MKIQHALMAVVILCTACCGPIPDLRDLTELDAYPPVLQGIHVLEARRLRLEFDESCEFIDDPYLTPELEISAITADGNSLIIDFVSSQQPGVRYYIDGSVCDQRGNSTDFILHFYGFNPRIPDMLINEFTTQGSGNHPDLVELYAAGKGNCAGMCLYEGTETNWDEMFVLPSIELETGDFILVHFKPEGIPEEVDETGATDISGGLDASPEAFDLWLPGGSGLSGNNGTLTLYSSPHGEPVDGVLYSNRTSASDETYRGFGSLKVMQRADELYELGEWTAQGELVAPEDAIDPEDSTSTRSICRAGEPVDTNSASDWHIVPTSGYTFGAINNDEVYVP